MRIFIVIAILGFVSCRRENQAESEAASVEPSVETAGRSLKDIDVSDHFLVLKLHVYSVFRTHVFVEVYFQGEEQQYAATSKAYRLTGAAGYDTGELDLFYERELGFMERLDGARWFEESDFWNMPEEDDVLGLDGTTWTIEAKQGDRYHRVMRWEPDDRMGEDQVPRFLQIGRWILDTTGILPYTPATQ